MKRVRAWLLGCALTLLGTPALADLQLVLQRDGLDPAQQQATQTLLDEAMAKLPPRFKQQLDRQILVGWTERMPEDAYGQASPVASLELNRRLLPGLVDGSAAREKTNRPHGTVREELLATVLHELTHIYDRARLWPDAERQLISRCKRQQGALGKVGLPQDCRGQAERRFTLSDDPRLLDLAGWPQYVGRRGEREQHNGQLVRSPDPYELSSPKEFIAVNMEYFLLDPSYGCRRPALNQYLRDHFGWAPQQDTCARGLPFLNAGNDFARQPLGEIDPERVYEVDYLLAEANQNWVSRWGHSMLRLVICAPGRPLGPACRLDLAEHRVLSFRAFVDDVQISNLRGLTGSYPSRLFVLPLRQVVDDYTQVQLRGLQSLPLRLSREEIAALLERAAQLHWSYDGRYYFLSNNCAVETYALLHDGVPRLAAAHLSGISPTGLRRRLVRAGIADASVFDDADAAVRDGYFFPAASAHFAQMFAVARGSLALPARNADAWLDLPAAQRAPWLERGDLRASAALLLLENAARRRAEQRGREALKRRYLGKPLPTAVAGAGGGDAGADTRDAASAVRAVLAEQGLLSQPASLLQGQPGYGLPQAQERAWLQVQGQARIAALHDDGAALQTRLRGLLPAPLQADLAQIDANLATLGARLRRLNREGGGLQLDSPSLLRQRGGQP